MQIQLGKKRHTVQVIGMGMAWVLIIVVGTVMVITDVAVSVIVDVK